jgi:hypothetical protein
MLYLFSLFSIFHLFYYTVKNFEFKYLGSIRSSFRKKVILDYIIDEVNFFILLFQSKQLIPINKILKIIKIPSNMKLNKIHDSKN